MKHAFVSLCFIGLGLFGFAFMVLFQYVTINNEADYYTLKEAMEASMYESVDKVYYALGDDSYYDPTTNKRQCYDDSAKHNMDSNCIINGRIKIVEQKFVENFTRRFAKNTMGFSEGYTLEFYDLMEYPAKVSVFVSNETFHSSITTDGSNYEINNLLSGILEANVSSITESPLCEDDNKRVEYDVTDFNTYSNNSITLGSTIIQSFSPSSISGVPSGAVYVGIESIEFEDFIEGSGCERKYLSYHLDTNPAVIYKKASETSFNSDIKLRITLKTVSDYNSGASCGVKYKIRWRYGVCKNI